MHNFTHHNKSHGFELNIIRTYQQKVKEYSACYRYDGLHVDTCIGVLYHAILCASSKFQTPPAQDMQLNIRCRQTSQLQIFERNFVQPFSG